MARCQPTFVIAGLDPAIQWDSQAQSGSIRDEPGMTRSAAQ